MFDQTLWFAARGSGVVSLLMFTASVCLGLATVARFWHQSWPRFFNLEMHRRISLLSVVFLLVHIAASILDPFAKLGIEAALVPFASAYRPLPMAMGVVATYLIAALIITGLLRMHIPWRIWRPIHWASYAMWPLALAHSILSGSDEGSLWMYGVIGVCVLAVGACAALRISVWEQSRGHLEDVVASSSWPNNPGRLDR
jgi:predicted ferric reductase